MAVADSVKEVLPGIFHWEAYSPEHKVALASHAVQHGQELVLFDPIAVSAEVLDWFPASPPTAIVLTNGNHLRDAIEWRERFGAPIYAPGDSGLIGGGIRGIRAGELPSEGWQAMPLPGGPAGETAFFLPARSLMVFGDAVVNLPTRGLEVLPAKYCTDHARLCASLRELVHTTNWSTALFAHGAPLQPEASARITGMLRAGTC